MQKYKISFISDVHGAPVVLKTQGYDLPNVDSALKVAHKRGLELNAIRATNLRITHVRGMTKRYGRWITLFTENLKEPMKFRIEYYTSSDVLIEREIVDLSDPQSAHDWAKQHGEDSNAAGAYEYSHYQLFKYEGNQLTYHQIGGTHPVKDYAETRDIGAHDIRKQAAEALDEMKLPDPEDD